MTGDLAVRAELLDCIQANLAVLADRQHGAGTHLALGAELSFRPRPGPQGLPTVDPPVEERLADAERWAGLVVADSWRDVPAAGVAALTVRHPVLYVVADSYRMPWLPYFGNRHMEHSFLLSRAGDRAAITDAYHNQTPWGLAEPGRWEIEWADLPDASLVVRLEPAAGGAPEITPSVRPGSSADFVAAYTRHPDRTAAMDRLAVETWLLARSRKLHAAFRWPAPPAEVAAHLARWDRVAGQAFVALRRVQRGRPEPGGLLPELAATLDADRTVFGATDDKETLTWTSASSTC